MFLNIVADLEEVKNTKRNGKREIKIGKLMWINLMSIWNLLDTFGNIGISKQSCMANKKKHVDTTLIVKYSSNCLYLYSAGVM